MGQIYINRVISYKGAWDTLTTMHKDELEDILTALSEVLSKTIKGIVDERTQRNWFQMFLEDKNWDTNYRTLFNDYGRRVSNSIALAKNMISVSYGHKSLDRWLFRETALDFKYEMINVPILLAPLKQGPNSFERHSTEILQLLPLNISHPFVIIGYSSQKDLFETDIFEIEAPPILNQENIIIDRSIEFPPEYYHAGVNILNFFGTYIREQYPDVKAKVKIEQEERIVRLKIEAEDGRKETIEKALEEYQLIITGKEKPEKFTQNEVLVMELRNEVRMAKFRIDSQNELIQYQNARLEMQNAQMETLVNYLGTALVKQNNIAIDFKPQTTISASNTIHVNVQISSAISTVNELLESLPKDSKAYKEIKGFAESLETIEKEKRPEVVRKSPAMSKFKRIVNTLTEGNNEAAKAIDAVEKGWDIVKDLAGKYNSIAQWCGLPQVPTIFTKR